MKLQTMLGTVSAVLILAVGGCDKDQAAPTTTPGEATTPAVGSDDSGGDDLSQAGEGPASISEVPDDVTVTVTIPEEAPSFDNAVVRVRIEDVSRADASAEVVSKTEMKGISHEKGQELSLEIPVRRPVSFDDKKSYSVAVHVDIDGDGSVGAQELLTTSAIPVLTQGAPTTVTATVQPSS